MNTREILSIVALAALGLCLLCGLAKMAMKGPKAKQSCDHACSLLVFVAVVLVGVSQLLEEEGYKELDLPYWEPGVGALPWTFSGEGKMKKKKVSMGLGDSGCCKTSGYPTSSCGISCNTTDDCPSNQSCYPISGGGGLKCCNKGDMEACVSTCGDCVPTSCPPGYSCNACED